MARKRMIDPEYWSDEEIGCWSFAARLFYIALWNFADDSGRFKAHNSLLKSQIFPYDKKVSIQKLKQELGNKVQWYEINGAKYGFIRNFSTYQKIDHPSESKLPPPPQFDESSGNVQGTIPPNIIEYNISKEKIREDNENLHPLQIFISNNYPNVSKLTSQLTVKQCETIISEYGKEAIKDILMQMENKKDLSKKYTSVYLTMNNWLKRRGEKQGDEKPVHDGKPSWLQVQLSKGLKKNDKQD